MQPVFAKKSLFLVLIFLAVAFFGVVIWQLTSDPAPNGDPSPMQKQIGKYDANFGFPYKNVYIDAYEISDWCYHINYGKTRDDYYYYEVKSFDGESYLILCAFSTLSEKDDITLESQYRLCGDARPLPDTVLSGIAEMLDDSTSAEELRERYGYRCLVIDEKRIEPLTPAS